MRSILLALILFVSGCAPTIKTYTVDLEPEVRARLDAEYASTSAPYARAAVFAHLKCKLTGLFYELAGKESTKPKGFLPFAESLYAAMNDDAATTSEMWSDAIQRRLEFNQVLAYKIHECALLKNPENLQKGMDKLKAIAKTSDDKRIFEILSDLQGKIMAPSGSLLSYNQSINNIRSEFTRAKSSYGMK